MASLGAVSAAVRTETPEVAMDLSAVVGFDGACSIASPPVTDPGGGGSGSGTTAHAFVA